MKPGFVDLGLMEVFPLFLIRMASHIVLYISFVGASSLKAGKNFTSVALTLLSYMTEILSTCTEGLRAE